MGLSTALINFKRVGPGALYLALAPLVDPGTGTQQSTEEGYYGLFYTDPAGKKTLKPGVKPFINADKSGINIKIKPSKVSFDPCLGTKTDRVTGIDTASAEVTAYDIYNPSHLVDIYGSQASDLITQVAATGKAARSIALIGPQSYNTAYVAMWRMASPLVPGEFWHYLMTNITMDADLDLKLSKTDEVKSKLGFQLECSPFLFNSAGNGVVLITDDPTAPGL
jgi:hypothetical protein